MAGEYYDNGKCEKCPDCYVLNTTFSMVKFAWESQSKYTDLLTTWSLPWKDQWKYQVVQIACVPLRRRKLSWNGMSIVVSGQDYYKVPADSAARKLGAVYMEQRVALFHTVQYNKLENDQFKCEYQHCQSICKAWVYQYSDGCGDRAPDPWLQLRTSTLLSPEYSRDAARKISNGAARVEDYDILYHGKCTKCRTCRSGEYNDECNVWDVSKLPQGQCKACVSGTVCSNRPLPMAQLRHIRVPQQFEKQSRRSGRELCVQTVSDVDQGKNSDVRCAGLREL